MAHYLDHAVASELSFQVLQLRARNAELGTQALDSSNQKLHPLPSQVVQREAFAADREAVVDSYQGERLQFIPVWHFHGRKG